MTDKALISNHTWRSLDMQRAAFPDMPHYVAPDELSMLLRPTTRTQHLVVHVVSFAVISKTVEGFTEFLDALPGNSKLVSKEEGWIIRKKYPIKKAIMMFKSARRFGAAKAGGEATAAKTEKEFWEGFSRIADRWHLPAKGENASKQLLDEADTSRNTAKRYLGYTREEWQKLSEATRQRILKRKARKEGKA